MLSELKYININHCGKVCVWRLKYEFSHFDTMRNFFTIFTAILLSACSNQSGETKDSPNQYVSLNDTLQLPFDTMRVLALYNMPVRAFLQDAPKDLDTFVLVDQMFACDCPRWATEDELQQEVYNNYANHDVFYLESGDKRLPLPDKFSVKRNKIKFYGKVRTRNGLPRNEGFNDPHPPPGPVLTVYGYEVLLPAYIYGPPVHVRDTAGKKPAWAQYEMTTLKVTSHNYFPEGR